MLSAAALASYNFSGQASQVAGLDQSKQLHVHSAAKQGLFVNSYLLVGETSSTLIDAQLEPIGANAVIELIKASAKPLKNIVITHPHPDHYQGLEQIGPAFPTAKIFSAQRSIETITETSKFWSNFENQFVPINSGTFHFSGFDCECLVLPDAESIAPTAMYVSQLKTLLAGDHALSKQHLWLAEGRGVEWIKNIVTIQNRWNIEHVLPGHGSPGKANTLNATRTYIADFLATVNRHSDPVIARQKMLDIYPEHRLTEALDTSLRAYL